MTKAIAISGVSYAVQPIEIDSNFADIVDAIEDTSSVECQACPLLKLECNKEFVKPSGYPRARVMLVGMNPSHNRRGNHVFGPEDSNHYDMMKEMLAEVGLSFETVYITNIQKCSTEDNKIDLKVLPTCISQKFVRELEIVDPELIICLGETVSNIFGLAFDHYAGPVKNGNYTIARAYHPSFFARKGGVGASDNFSHLKELIKKIKVKNFVNLHVHNEFSIRDGIGTAEEHIIWALKHKSPAVSLTNHGNISVFFKQYEAARKVGIKPIFGTEAYMIADRAALMPFIGSKEDGAVEQRKIHGNPRHHILLIAKNYTGLKNLFKITSLSFIESFYRFPLIDFKLLSENKEGIIVSTACAGGELNRLLEHDKMDEARAYVKKYKDEFGDNFYIELMSMDYSHQWRLNPKLWAIAKEMGVTPIVTTDAHYLYPNDQKVHEAILLLQTKKSYTEEKEKEPSEEEVSEEDQADNENEKLWEFVVKDLYLKTFDQIIKDWKEGRWFGDNPPADEKEAVAAAINGSYEVFSKVDSFQLDTSLKIPKLYEDAARVLYQKVADALVVKGFSKNEVYRQRCRHEYDIIIKLGFVDYFLILEDMIKWTKQKFGRYEVGAGRGSAAGSLINYLLEITDVDPIKHGLLFERFLDEGRKDLPDVDIDFSPAVRDEVKQYLVDKYGADKVATIGNYHIGKVKGCIKDASRIYNLDYQTVNEITKDLPFTIYTTEGKKEQLDNMPYDYLLSHFPKVKKFFEQNPNVETLFKRLRNSIKATGRHAAGVVVSGVTIYDWIPLIRSKEFIVTANTEGGDYHELTGQGFVKFDILGLNNLAVVNDTVRLINSRHKVDIDWDKIDIDSKEAYALARKGDLFGVFQFESNLALKTILDVKPECFDDLSAINAIIRPGPLDMGMNVEFAKRKAAGNWRDLTHESYADYLKGTYGIVVYQEDFMRLFKELGEFDPIEINKSRKDLVKYERSTKYETARLKRVDSWEHKFVTNASKKMPAEVAKELWEQIRAFSRYAFNKSHSDSYTYTSFRELWLKAHYGIEFYTALLNNTARSKEDKYGTSTIAKYISRIQTSAIYYESEGKFIKRDKVKILPVDVNESDFEFSIDKDGNIRFGLTFVKGITPDAAAEIIRRRPFTGINDFINSDHKQLKNKRVIVALIQSGALDSIAGGVSRADMYNEFVKIRKYKEDPVSWSLSDIIANEIELMNVSFTEVTYFVGQRDRIKEKYPDFKLRMLEDVVDLENEGELAAVFRISTVEKKKSKKGKPYYVVGLSDGISSMSRVYYWGDKEIQDGDQKIDIMDTNNLYIGKLQRSNSYNQLRQLKLIDKISR
jgi:DNA polymerase-3 subunit alpha